MSTLEDTKQKTVRFTITSYSTGELVLRDIDTEGRLEEIPLEYVQFKPRKGTHYRVRGT